MLLFSGRLEHCLGLGFTTRLWLLDLGWEPPHRASRVHSNRQMPATLHRAVPEAAAGLAAEKRQNGRTVDMRDTQIAGVVIARRATLASAPGAEEPCERSI
jgi:hypothetical protein